jgi:transcriptional accessory protein Tex/SPT6
LSVDLRVRLFQNAEDDAVKVFAGNLRDLLLAPPAGARATMGLDPGFRTGVKVAVVDSTGKVLDLQFNPTKDGSYNRKLRDALIAIRFRPAVNAQGVPVRARTEITYSL